jgi:hypothetical protein
MVHFLSLALMGTACGTVLCAQELPCLRRTVIANVVDAHGNPVPGLTASDFQAKFRGKPVKIVSYAPAQHPPRILILLDTSRTMLYQRSRKWQFALQAADLIVQESPTGKSVGLATFSNRMNEEVEFDDGVEVVRRRMKSLREEMRDVRYDRPVKLLWDSLARCLEVFASLQSGDVIYLVTRGGDAGSKAKPKTVENVLLSRGVRLFVVFPMVRLSFSMDSLDPSIESLDQLPPNERSLDVMAEMTGGTVLDPFDFLTPTDRTDIRAAAMHGANDLLWEETLPRFWNALKASVTSAAQFHVLEVELPEAITKPTDIELKFEVSQELKKKHPVVLYPHKLWPCKP